MILNHQPDQHCNGDHIGSQMIAGYIVCPLMTAAGFGASSVAITGIGCKAGGYSLLVHISLKNELTGKNVRFRFVFQKTQSLFVPPRKLFTGIQASTVTDQDYKPKPESFLYKKKNLLL